MSQKEKLITKKTIKEMGFTEKLIRELLAEPKLVQNPHYKYGSAMQLWKMEDVEKAMESFAFKDTLSKREARKAAAGKALETKKEKEMAKVEEFAKNIHIERKSLDQLKETVLDAQKRRHGGKDLENVGEETISR